ncbi:MAG: PASTA domain-containing protein [Proteobacteria bacterium]|nr:PASTA domain-containing protein [Pseudomonadota bacterium]MBU1737048.1 PASTA domain-containing protein [Pseudomonadota bacterium]
MKDVPGKAGKRNIALAIGILFLIAWLGALVVAIKDTFFTPRTIVAKSFAEDLQMSGATTATRYKILDRRHEELAVSFRMNSVYARPLEIADPEKGVAFLAETLELDEKMLLRELRAERSFVWLGRHLPAEKTAGIQKKGLPGVYITNESQRYYPFHQTASHVLGFLKDDHGLAGVESFYDRMLRVTAEDTASSGANQEITGHVVLALDIRVQELLEKQLGLVMSEADAGSAIGLVMRPSNGAILAMSSLPTYDPNLFWDFGAAERRNLAINDLIHIGGFNRLFRLAALYEKESRAGAGEGSPAGSIEALKMSLQGEYQPRSLAEDGVAYFSLESGTLVSGELFWDEEFKLSPAEELQFKEMVGLTGDIKVDLPLVNSVSSTGKEPAGKPPEMYESGLQTTAVNLATAFSRIINDGSPLTPHLATGILGPNSGKTARLRHEKPPGVLSPETGNRIRNFLSGFARKKDDAVFMEAFQVMENPLEKRLAALAASSAARGDVVAGNDGKNSKRSRPERYQTLLLGFAPLEKPDLALLIVLKDAVLDQGRKSPTRVMAEKNMNTFRKLANEEWNPSGQPTDSSAHARAYQEWLRSNKDQKTNSDLISDEEQVRMPDLRGMSLRKALQVIQPLGLTIRVKGSGEVVSQEPGPGKKISKEVCVLELKESRK